MIPCKLRIFLSNYIGIQILRLLTLLEVIGYFLQLKARKASLSYVSHESLLENILGMSIRQAKGILFGAISTKLKY